MVFRNHDKEVVGGVFCKVLNVTSPKMVEALASRAACECALHFGFHPVSFEVDSLLVVQATKATGPNASLLGRIYKDISACLDRLPNASFSHIFRSSNGKAHLLDKLALQASLHLSWSGV